jgi:hypothetical protein
LFTTPVTYIYMDKLSGALNRRFGKRREDKATRDHEPTRKAA